MTSNQLTWHDLQFALLRTPKALLRVMKCEDWAGKIFVGGGFLRSIVAGDPVNDVDVFTLSKDTARRLAKLLVSQKIGLRKELQDMTKEDLEKIERNIYETDNAFTLTCFTPVIQIIHRWSFETGPGVSDSFDFTCCAAVFWWGKELLETEENGWHSYCDPRFYADVAGKRLIYRNPVRNEEAGGSLLRVLKYYQKGYRIPLDCLADVITRLMRGVDFSKCRDKLGQLDEAQFSKVICGLLREVDPNIDPSHVAHLPAEETVKGAGKETND